MLGFVAYCRVLVEFPGLHYSALTVGMSTLFIVAIGMRLGGCRGPARAPTGDSGRAPRRP